MFNFGASWGAVRTLFGSYFPLAEPAPTTWKRSVGIKPSPAGLTPAEKKRNQEDQALALVRSWWPHRAELFELRKHAGRAEAACIAEHGRRYRIDLGLPC